MIIISSRVDTHKDQNIDHRGKEIGAIFDLPIQNKSSGIVLR